MKILAASVRVASFRLLAFVDGGSERVVWAVVAGDGSGVVGYIEA